MFATLTNNKNLFTGTLTSKGQVTIPKMIREILNVKPGDEVDFVIQGDNVSLRPAVSIMSLRGLLPKPKKSIAIEEMNKAIRNVEGS